MPANATRFRKNVISLFFGQASRLVIQAVYFVVLARMLGASDYGAFAAALALATLVIPFSSVGTNTLMIKNVSRDPESAAIEWRRALVYAVVGGLFFSVFLFAVSNLVLPSEVSRLAFLQICLAELVGLKLVELVGFLWQSAGKSLALVVLPSLLNFVRLAAASAVLFLATSSSLELWATVYLCATLPLGFIVAIHTTFKVGSAPFRLKLTMLELREGLLYSISMASQNVYNDIDKAMLGRISSASSAGIYSAAYRIIDMAYAPIRALATAAYPLFFREGEEGLSGALRLAKKLMPAVLAIGIVAGGACVLAAPIVPMLLGPDYESSVDVIRVLAPLVLLRGFSFLAADTLTGCGRQGIRAIAQISIAGLNVGMNLVLIPMAGVGGAVISTLTCEALLAGALWMNILISDRYKAAAPGIDRSLSEGLFSCENKSAK